MKIFSDILNFLFPRNCVVCLKILTDNENIICSECYYGIPRTNFHNDPDNPVIQLFWGRVNISHATSYFYYNKAGQYQKLIYGLKYQGRSDIGIEAGRMFGAELRESAFSAVDAVMPVPLHKKKLRKRGYNQSEMIARGICSILNKPLVSDMLERVEFTDTQTRRSRYDRYTNVSGCFRIKGNYDFSGKHILVVDDVITTGSTLEACAEILLEEGIRVSVATLAVA